MIYTTLNKHRPHGPCADGWVKFLRHVGKTQPDDEPIAMSEILQVNGLQDAVFCLRSCDLSDSDMRRFAIWCAQQVVSQAQVPAECMAALAAAQQFNSGEIGGEVLVAAWLDARRVARDDAANAVLSASILDAAEAVFDTALFAKTVISQHVIEAEFVRLFCCEVGLE